jgi:hypothetical protein
MPAQQGTTRVFAVYNIVQTPNAIITLKKALTGWPVIDRDIWLKRDLDEAGLQSNYFSLDTSTAKNEDDQGKGSFSL